MAAASSTRWLIEASGGIAGHSTCRRIGIYVHREKMCGTGHRRRGVGHGDAEDRVEIRRRVGAHQQCASPAVGQTDGGRARERRLSDTALPCEEVESNRMVDEVTQGAGHCGQRGTRHLALRLTIHAQQLSGRDQGRPEEERLGNGLEGRSLDLDRSAL